MENVYALLFFAAIIGAVILWNRATSAAGKAINRKVLFRAEYEEGQRIVAGLTIHTTASIPEIMAQLASHVTTTDAPLGFKAELYEASRDDDRVTYAYGNKLVPATFRAVVALTDHGDETQAVFAIPNWTEREGLIVAQSEMRSIRKQVKAAFKAADPAARFSGGLEDDATPASHQSGNTADSTPLPGEGFFAEETT